MTIHELAKYNTSRDYEKLADLMQKESIICTVQYHECRDTGRTVFSTSEDGHGIWQINGRGMGYVYAFNRTEFIEQCTRGNVEFIEPPESVRSVHSVHEVQAPTDPKKYPTLAQVATADREQLARWARFLPSPSAEELEIINEIMERFTAMGGFTPELSKKIGWGEEGK
jgi:hypothetical protein